MNVKYKGFIAFLIGSIIGLYTVGPLFIWIAHQPWFSITGNPLEDVCSIFGAYLLGSALQTTYLEHKKEENAKKEQLSKRPY